MQVGLLLDGDEESELRFERIVAEAALSAPCPFSSDGGDEDSGLESGKRAAAPAKKKQKTSRKAKPTPGELPTEVFDAMASDERAIYFKDIPGYINKWHDERTASETDSET